MDQVLQKQQGAEQLLFVLLGLKHSEHTEDARHCVPGGDGGHSLSNPRHHLEAADVLLKEQPHCTSLLTLAFSTLLLTELLWREYFAKNMHNILVPDLNDSLLVLAG